VFPVDVDITEPSIGFTANNQYMDWVEDMVTGDFGYTFESKRPIREEFVERFPETVEILILSLAFSAVFGVAFGILSAMYRNGIIDYVVRIFAVLGSSIPEFFLLALLVILPSYWWNYAMPTGGNTGIFEDPVRNARLFLPAAIVVGIGGSAGLMRLTRTTMLEVLRSDYVRTAHAKGLHRRTVVLSHALRNSSTPILTALGTAFIAVFGGSIIVETVLSIQGLGGWFFRAALIRDLPVVQFLALYTAALVVLINLVVDLSYGWADPRVRYN
jgi:peptide/nickel transport system permease protein